MNDDDVTFDCYNGKYEDTGDIAHVPDVIVDLAHRLKKLALEVFNLLCLCTACFSNCQLKQFPYVMDYKCVHFIPAKTVFNA